jgi:hypothetical protein
MGYNIPKNRSPNKLVPHTGGFLEMQYAVKAEKDGMDPSRRSG